MKLKNVLVFVALTGVVLAAAAQGMGGYGPGEAGSAVAPFGAVLKAWSAGGSLVDSLLAGEASEQNMMVLAGLALVATIVRRSARRNG